MEYEEDENNVPGNFPEFGAIFMSNAETKRECFKQRVFALPQSKAGFVKNVKTGMVLFLFEFEKRQLFGVYEATSDGALNILPNVFRSGGKYFPAQVCFTPIWLCSPLSENEFKSAIHENYYTPRKFKFGLSEDQVRRLLRLFSTRKLKGRLPAPPRQVTGGVSWFSSKGRRRIDHREFGIREGLEMQRSNKDFNPTVMGEYMENLEDRGTQEDDMRFYMDDRIQDGENLYSSRQGFLTGHADASLHKKRRISYEGLETEEVHASSLSFGTDNGKLPMDKERIPAASSSFLGGDNIDDSGNSFNSLSPAIATKYSEQPFDLTKAADYERPYSDGNRLATIDGRFLLSDTMETEVGLHNGRRPIITNEHDSCLFKRAGEAADDREFLRNSKLGLKHYIGNGIARVVPSESFETSLPMARGTAGHRELLTNERVIYGHDPGSVLGIRFSSAKVLNPLDTHHREFDEQRFPRDNLAKADYVEGLTGSATPNLSSGYDARIERQIPNDFVFSKTCSIDNVQHFGTFSRPGMSTKSRAFHQPSRSSVDGFDKPFPDTQFPGLTTESQNFLASNSIFHDAVVTRSVPSVSEFPSIHHERSISFGALQSASVAEESIPHQAGGNFLRSSKGKSFETDGSNRYKTSDFGDKVPFPNDHNYCSSPTDEVASGVNLKSPSFADCRTYQFTPSALASVPFSKSDDFSTRRSPLACDGLPYVASQGMQKYIPGRRNDEQKCIPGHTNDELYAGNELLSPYANSTELDIRYQEKDPINRHSEFSREYRADLINDDILYYGSPEGPCSDTKKRKSVFTRLKSTPKLYALEDQEEDANIYGVSSVDEVMEMLHQSQNVRMKSLKKSNLPFKHHYEEEQMERNSKKVSLENHIELGQSKMILVKTNKDANPAIEQCVDDKPKETRMVEFKRRREMKKSLDDESLETNVIRKQDSESGESKENKFPLDKQGRRRKLVRPVFDQNNLVNGTNNN